MADGRKLKSYLVVEQGSSREETKVKTEEEPKWDESFTFVITDLVQDIVSIKLMEKALVGDDRLAGAVTIPVADILKANGQIEKDFNLEDNDGKLGQSAKLHAHLLLRTYTGSAGR
mmetsp:Transcript_24723/g.38193  ORF Transcript_24723/g.38193 Transcript_24723/m.38193 type:complete len:116 (-) Transcript_24723:277-624(-)